MSPTRPRSSSSRTPPRSVRPRARIRTSRPPTTASRSATSTAPTTTTATRSASASPARPARTTTSTRWTTTDLQERGGAGMRRPWGQWRGAPFGSPSSPFEADRLAAQAGRLLEQLVGQRLDAVAVAPLHRAGDAERVQRGLVHDLAGGLEQLAQRGGVVAQEAQLHVLGPVAMRDPLRGRERERVLAAGVRAKAAGASQAERRPS